MTPSMLMARKSLCLGSENCSSSGRSAWDSHVGWLGKYVPEVHAYC